MAGGGELRSGRAAVHDRKMVSEKYVFLHSFATLSREKSFVFFTAERSERVQKTYFSLANIFMRLLLFCATPLNLPLWSLFFLMVVEVARPPTLVSWGSSAVLLDILCQCVLLMIMTYTGYYIPFLAVSILGSDWQRGRN